MWGGRRANTVSSSGPFWSLAAFPALGGHDVSPYPSHARTFFSFLFFFWLSSENRFLFLVITWTLTMIETNWSLALLLFFLSHFSKPSPEAPAIFMKSQTPKMSPCLVKLRSTVKFVRLCLPLVTSSVVHTPTPSPRCFLGLQEAEPSGRAGVWVLEQSLNRP